MNKLALLKSLEAAARPLRRLGAGPLVDRVRGRALDSIGTFTVEIDGLKLSGDVTAHSHYIRELVDEQRERLMTDLFKAAIEPGMSVLDVGAHLGYLTLQGARRVGPNGHVYAVEPHPATRRFLLENLRLNGVVERVTPVHTGLAATPGTRSLFLSDGGDASSLFEGSTPTARETIAVTTADDLLGEQRVDVVKLDIEGAEVEALAGMRTLFAMSPDVTVFAECNPEALERAGASASGLLGALRESELVPAVIDERARRVAPVASADDLAPYLEEEQRAGRPAYVNLVCVRSPERLRPMAAAAGAETSP